MAGLKKVLSISQPGLSSITTFVDIDKYDADEVVAELQRAVDSVNTLPQDLRAAIFLEIKSEEFPVIELAITGGDSERDRFDIAEHLKELLEDNRKISGIAIDGFVKKQFAIEVDPKLLLKIKFLLTRLQMLLWPETEISLVDLLKLAHTEPY